MNYGHPVVALNKCRLYLDLVHPLMSVGGSPGSGIHMSVYCKVRVRGNVKDVEKGTLIGRGHLMVRWS
jgi:hypothetical protein